MRAAWHVRRRVRGVYIYILSGVRVRVGVRWRVRLRVRVGMRVRLRHVRGVCTTCARRVRGTCAVCARRVCGMCAACARRVRRRVRGVCGSVCLACAWRVVEPSGSWGETPTSAKELMSRRV